MFTKGSKLSSMIKGTCPRCQEESMYEVSNPYYLSKAVKMHENCSHCHLHYAIEPSFFYGAKIDQINHQLATRTDYRDWETDRKSVV